MITPRTRKLMPAHPVAFLNNSTVSFHRVSGLIMLDRLGMWTTHNLMSPPTLTFFFTNYSNFGSKSRKYLEPLKIRGGRSAPPLRRTKFFNAHLALLQFSHPPPLTTGQGTTNKSSFLKLSDHHGRANEQPNYHHGEYPRFLLGVRDERYGGHQVLPCTASECQSNHDRRAPSVPAHAVLGIPSCQNT